jgi:2-polyprenyl-3-methyl-5-hydroxy-6-metoxy-1,4-benzoquinol methylase
MTATIGTPEYFDAVARTWDEDPAKLERARLAAEAIAAAVPDLATRRVLDYGCGTGLLGFALLPRAAHVTFADTSREMLAVVGEKAAAAGVSDRATPLALDLAAGPPPAARFDLACSLMAMHHVRDTEALLRAFHALLAPGGVLAVADLDAEDGSFHGAEADVHRGFDRGGVAAVLARAGFGPAVFSTVFTVEKGGRRYPVFLAVARRG